jgi:hypothetical protein
MKRTLKDTERKVRIIIDNFSETTAEGFLQRWSAGAAIDGTIVTYEVMGATAEEAFQRISVALEHGGDLDDPLFPIPEKDKEPLLAMLRAIFDTWGHSSDIPDWRENEYIRGQLELVIEMYRVISDEEWERGDSDIDSERDRITDWLKAQVWR